MADDYFPTGIVQTYETKVVQRKAIQFVGEENLAQVQVFVGRHTDMFGKRHEKFQSPFAEGLKEVYPDLRGAQSALYEQDIEAWIPVFIGDWIVERIKGFGVYTDQQFAESFTPLKVRKSISATLPPPAFAPLCPEVGSVWEWEPLKSQARALVRVTETKWNGEEVLIESELLMRNVYYKKVDQRSARIWNTLSRWVQAAVQVEDHTE